jgi:hypothetical protein
LIKKKLVALISLAKLAFQILFAAHLCGCTYYYLQEMEKKNGIEQTWTHNLDHTNDPNDWVP